MEREGDGRPVDRGHAFWAAFAALGLAYLVPLWVARALPAQDLPNHLAVLDVLARRGTEPGWSQHFAVHLSARPYATYYALGLALARPLGALAANRVLLGAYVLALPAALLALIRASGSRNRWPALLGFPLAYNDAYLVGFTNFLLGLPMALAALALVVAELRDPRPGPARRGLLCLWGVALYLTHPLDLALAGLAAAACAFGFAPGARAVLRLAPAGAVWLLLLALAALEGGTSGAGGLHWGVGTKLAYMAAYPALVADAAARAWGTAVAATGAVVLALGFFSGRAAPAGEGARRRGGFGWAVAAMLGAYVLLPFGRGAVLWLDARAAPFAWLLAVAWGAGRVGVGGRGRTALLAFCAVAWAGVTAGHVAFARESAPLFALLARVRAGRRVLPVALDRESAAMRPFYERSGAVRPAGLYTHFGGYYRLERGGTYPFLAFHRALPWMPVTLLDPGFETFALADPFRPRHVLARLPEVACRFDALLVRGADPAAVARIATFATRVDREGEFAWFELRPCGNP